MQKPKNSLLQLYRFIFACFILLYHNLFVVEVPLFSHADYSVEFFFLLSGCFLLTSFKRYENISFKEACPLLIKNYLLRLGIPLAIGYLFSLLRTIVDNTWLSGVMHYLWFVHVLLITELLFLLLRKLIKKDKTYLIVIGLISFVSIVLRTIPFFYDWGFLRSFGYVGIGIFISKIPLLKDKKIFKALFVLISIVSFLGILQMFYFPENHYTELIFDLVLLPSLIYSVLNLSFSNRICNYLGSISFGVYAFQPIGWAIITLGNTNQTILFLTIMFLAIITNELNKIIKEKKY